MYFTHFCAGECQQPPANATRHPPGAFSPAPSVAICGFDTFFGSRRELQLGDCVPSESVPHHSRAFSYLVVLTGCLSSSHCFPSIMSPLSLPLILRRSPLLRVASFKSPIPVPKRLPPVHFTKLFTPRLYSSHANMKPEELKHYLADQPPTVVRLEIEKHFEPLSDQQKRYAHFVSK